MAKDRLIFICSFIFLSLLAAFLFRSSSQSSSSTNDSGMSSNIKPTVLVANTDLKENEPLLAENYSWAEINPKDSNYAYIMRNEETEKNLKDSILAKSLHKGDKIKYSDLSFADDHQPALPLRAGFVSVALQIPARSPLTSLIQVNQSLNLKFKSNAEIGLSPITLTLFENIPLLAIQELTTGKNLAGKNYLYKPNAFLELFSRDDT